MKLATKQVIGDDEMYRLWSCFMLLWYVLKFMIILCLIFHPLEFQMFWSLPKVFLMCSCKYGFRKVLFAINKNKNFLSEVCNTHNVLHLIGIIFLYIYIYIYIYTCREEIFDPADFPASYKDNLPKELLVLQYADNFRRQYVHLYRDRKPLFLNPVNECLVEVCLLFKLVSLCVCLVVYYSCCCYSVSSSL